ncbi:hypothetical protein ACF0H5_022751 [Mactra antiquata]
MPVLSKLYNASQDQNGTDGVDRANELDEQCNGGAIKTRVLKWTDVVKGSHITIKRENVSNTLNAIVRDIDQIDSSRASVTFIHFASTFNDTHRRIQQTTEILDLRYHEVLFCTI